jgi:hypothetical protein
VKAFWAGSLLMTGQYEVRAFDGKDGTNSITQRPQVLRHFLHLWES